MFGEVGETNLRVARLEAALCVLQGRAHESVEPLADALEHDQAERDSNQGIDHAKEPAGCGRRRRVSITCVSRLSGWAAS